MLKCVLNCPAKSLSVDKVVNCRFIGDNFRLAGSNLRNLSSNVSELRTAKVPVSTSIAFSSSEKKNFGLLVSKEYLC